MNVTPEIRVLEGSLAGMNRAVIPEARSTTAW